jgi:antitoxin Phd
MRVRRQSMSKIISHIEDKGGTHKKVSDQFINGLGDWVKEAKGGAAKSIIPATQAKNNFGRILEDVLQGKSIVITKHDVPKAVLISMEEFKELSSAKELSLVALRVEFDALFARMQTPKARAAMKSAFQASPREMGKTAVIAARKRG